MRQSLASLTLAARSQERFISDDTDKIILDDLRNGSCFASLTVGQMRGKSVLLATTKQLPTVLAAIKLDGIASRILLCTPDLIPHLASIITDAKVDAIVTDDGAKTFAGLGPPLFHAHSKIVSREASEPVRDVETEWVLFTSGTTGRPKLVAHTLSSLSGPLNDGVAVASGAIWSTFYDIRRYGGLTILFRALLGGGSMVLSSAQEAVDAFLTRLGAAGITHLTGTPSHWRRAIVNHAANAITPAYVRLSGEVADQAILDRLHRTYPNAAIAHAFASTEAGVGFDVRDGLAGFPESFIPHPNDNTTIELRVANGTLHIRSSRTASGYIGRQLHGSDGFIDTGDLIEQHDGRYYFMGRKEGVINVGGRKVYPEEVENVITQHPEVLMARVWPRKSPIMGAIVSAEVVLRNPVNDSSFKLLCASLRLTCQQALGADYKVPVSWQQVDTIQITASGKVRRA